MSGKHSQPIRGLMSTKSSPLFEGKFGRMFRSLRRATYGADDAASIENLDKLGAVMVADFDAPKDGSDDEESGIPALYTYLGQFIDHDITFDPASSLQQQNDPDALVDFRTPALDLDNVYGRGPDDQPYMYDANGLFLFGAPLRGGDSKARDLARNAATPARALIGDPRNDENVIVSQLQGLFLRFHNRIRTENAALAFEDVQRLVRFHYQYVVVNDFLPRIVHSSVLAALKGSDDRYDSEKLRFFHWRQNPFIPVEFSVAAYRLGHSMVRPGYRLNDQILLPIFPVPSKGLPEGLTGFRAMNTEWGIDWSRFVDVDVRADADATRRLQFAYRIDTSLVNPLGMLPPTVAANPSSLPKRNLERGFRLSLPSGQSVARAMGITPLDDDHILIGKATGIAGDVRPINDKTLALPEVFRTNCPLWTYILAEAMAFQEDVTIPVKEASRVKTPRLGSVGGRLVAEVFLGLLFGDRHSYLSLDPQWYPAAGKHYALKDFVSYALGR